MTLNPGIARWLQFEIAKSTGVSFGWDFPLPGKLFARVLRGFEPSFDITGSFPEDLARWQLLEVIENLEDQERFSQVRSYCQSADGRRRFAFASRLTKLYDEYLVYRPDTMIEWEDEPNASHFDWQAELWRRLARKLYPQARKPRHIARLWHELRRGQILELGLQPSYWPERLFVFGVSSLAPLYLDLLDQLSLYRPVHIFLLQPSDLYWADLKTTKQIQKIAKKQARKSGCPATTKPEDWLYETGNPLLPSLGKQSQMFLDLLIDKDPLQDDAGFAAPDETLSQLSALQSDLFTIEDRDLAKGSESLPPCDGTIQVHSCSGRRREVETVWDLIVGRLEADPQLKASEILVMAPDIQKYRSHIDAVFKAKRGTKLDIPYSIADRSAGNRPGVFSGLFAILKAVSSRASSAEVLALVETPLLREVFSFSDQDIERIEFWIRELGITWGWDAKHREQHSSFATDRNTWREMRSRLMSGSLFADPVETPDGFLAYTEIEGDLSETAGRLLECLNLLRELRQSYLQSLSLESWQERMLSILSGLRSNREDWQRDFTQAGELIRETLPSLNDVFASGTEVYSALADKFESSVSGGGYLSGGVTFCSLKPMRAIPANTVCLMGMNRLDFPRRNNRLSFDLMARESRIGDRNTRDEDRQFFLETLLSVRSHLLITYQGISPNSDSLSEPSAVVEELLNYLGNAMSEEEFQRLQYRQKRQSFDPAYFRADEQQTWDPDRALLRNRFDGNEQAAHAESAQSLDEQTSPSELDLEALVRFYSDPSKAYAATIAKITVDSSEDALEESDALSPSGLNRYKLNEAFSEQIARGLPVEAISYKTAAQKKLLPLGLLELPAYDLALEKARSLADAVGPLETETRFLEGEFAGVRLMGESTVRTSDGRQILIIAGELKAKRVAAAWIRHLFASALDPAFSGQTYVVSLFEVSKPLAFSAVEDARGLLEDLVSHWISAQDKPLPFFPVLSETTAKAWLNEASDSDEARLATALDKARWDIKTSRMDSDYPRSFEWSSYDRICFGNDYLPDETFVQIALSFWLKCFEYKSPLDLDTVKGGEA